jgi:hypothetical protein
MPRVAAWECSDNRFASVRKCAERFLKLNIPLHLLINNAGLAGAKGITENGFELAFGRQSYGALPSHSITLG